ncbi:MAG TPA: hypothetical protein GXZ52_01720 [Clostridiales bacterium]|nr:hypothetical protein [Clostridiales bacterium]
MIELKNYLSIMEPKDRETALSRYEAIFDEAGEEKEDEVIARLGSPAKVAIAIKREFEGRVPAPADTQPVPEGTGDESSGSALEDENSPEEDVSSTAPEVDEAEKEVQAENTQESPDTSLGQPAPEKRLRPLLLVLYIIPAVIIGIPLVALALALSVALFAAGVAALGGGVQVFILGFSVVGLISDSLLLFGAGLVIFAVGLVLAWFAIWLCGSSLRGIVGGIFSLGRRACYKEVRSA